MLVVLVRLNEQRITIVLIEHIMRLVMSFSTRLVVLVAGQEIADGAPQAVIRNPEVERAYLGGQPRLCPAQGIPLFVMAAGEPDCPMHTYG
jgi:ABC-type uncharacterized transport system ATPase subunit